MIMKENSMKRLLTCVIVAGALAFGGGSAVAKDKPVDDKPAVEEPAAEKAAAMVALPDEASAALTKAFPNAKVTYVRAGVFYTVRMAREKEPSFLVFVSETGVIVKVITNGADFPKAVAEAVTAAAPGATVKMAQRVEQRAGIEDLKSLDKPEVNYEITFAKGDEQGSMTVAEDGTVKRKSKMWRTKKPKDTTKPSK